MGVTLHAIVEVQIQGRQGLTRWPEYWEDVSTWELNKNYELSIAVRDMAHDGWPRTSSPSNGPMDPWLDAECTGERRRVDEEDIASMRCWATLPELRALPGPAEDDPDKAYAFRGRFLAIMAACEELAKHYGGPERVRVLFYSIT